MRKLLKIKCIIYHLGSSINYIGIKTFAINIIEEPIVKNLLLNVINKMCKYDVKNT